MYFISGSLENALRKFACLTTGDMIAINYNDRVFYHHYLAFICMIVSFQNFVARIFFRCIEAQVSLGHCCYRIGPIHFLAGWRKRRPNQGEFGFVMFSCLGFFCVVYYFS